MGAHEQLVVQVVDSIGKSKFSILSLSPDTKWADFLIDVVNRTVTAQQWCIANAISCAVRSVDPSTKCLLQGPFSLDTISEDSDFCFFRFFSHEALATPRKTSGFALKSSIFGDRAKELLEGAFRHVSKSVDWTQRLAPGFQSRVSPYPVDLSELTLTQVLSTSLPEIARGHARHVIIKFHVAISSRSAFNDSEGQNIASGLFRLSNWFFLYHQRSHNPERTHPVSIRARNIDTVKLTASEASIEAWFDRPAFVHFFLVFMAALRRDNQGTPFRQWFFELDFVSRWIDTRLKFFLMAQKSKIMRELVRVGTSAGTPFSYITQRGILMLREALDEEALFRDTLWKDLCDLEGPFGPTTFMSFEGAFSGPLTPFRANQPQIPTLPLRELQVWAAHFLFSHSSVSRAFQAGVRHMSARDIDKALAVIELRKCFAFQAEDSRHLQDFDAGVVYHPDFTDHPGITEPPSLALIRESSVKLVVIGHMTEEDFLTGDFPSIVNLAVSPLSRLSQQVQDTHLDLMERDLSPDDPLFFELLARLELLKTNLQRMLTKCILQANADELAKRSSAGPTSLVLPNTWFFEQAWDSLKWAQASAHTLLVNTTWRISPDVLDVRSVLGTFGFELLSQSALGQLLWKNCSSDPHFQGKEQEFRQAVVRLCMKFAVREQFSQEESQMVLFPDMFPVFWVPEVIGSTKIRELFDPSLLKDSQGSLRRKILHIHVMVKPEFMGIAGIPEFIPILQGVLGFEEEDMKLDNRELKFFETPNRQNALLALNLFETEDNSLFYRRSLLLRILTSDSDFEERLFYVNRQGLRKPMALDFKSRASLAARLLKKRDIHLCLSFDTAEGAAHIFQSNDMVASRLAFGRQAVSFSMLIPAPIVVWDVKMFADSQARGKKLPLLGGTWANLTSLKKIAEVVFPRFVSLVVFSQKHDRCFEAKIPLAMNMLVQNAWGWSELSLSGGVTNEEADALPVVSRARPRLPHRKTMADLSHRYTTQDKRLDEITPRTIEDILRFEDPLNESAGFPQPMEGEPHPQAFRAKCLSPSRQGVPFLIRDGVSYSFGTEAVDSVRKGDLDQFLLGSVNATGTPRRSIFALLGTPIDLTQQEDPQDILPSSPLVGLWVQLLGVLQDLDQDVIPVSAAFESSRLFGIAPVVRESVVSVDWDKARDATTASLVSIRTRSLLALFAKLDRGPRVLLHMVLFYHELSHVPLRTLRLPLALERHKWLRLPLSSSKRSYFLSKFLASCVETAVKVDLTSNQAVVTCPFPKLPASIEELEALTVMAHDLSAVNTRLREDDQHSFLLEPAVLGRNAEVPWFLMADQLRMVIHTNTRSSEPQHLLMELKIPYADMLSPLLPQPLQSMVSGRR